MRSIFFFNYLYRFNSRSPERLQCFIVCMKWKLLLKAPLNYVSSSDQSWNMSQRGAKKLKTQLDELVCIITFCWICGNKPICGNFNIKNVSGKPNPLSIFHFFPETNQKTEFESTLIAQVSKPDIIWFFFQNNFMKKPTRQIRFLESGGHFQETSYCLLLSFNFPPAFVWWDHVGWTH